MRLRGAAKREDLDADMRRVVDSSERRDRAWSVRISPPRSASLIPTRQLTSNDGV